MSRRSLCLTICLVVVLACGVGATAYGLLRYEPGHYTRAAVEEGDRRSQLAKEFLTEVSLLLNSIANDKDWGGQFRDEELNGYMADTFLRSGHGEKLLPEGISEPRVLFEPDRMRLAFRYRSRLVNTIVSVSLRIWLPKAEGNVVAVQLADFRAGALPCTAQWLLERISEVARQNGIEVNWYRHEGHPVAILRFQADQPRPTMQLKAIQLEQGQMTITGRSSEDRAALPFWRRWLALGR